MCLRDLMRSLQERGLDVSEAQIRWAIKRGKVPRPLLDGSLRFNFEQEHVENFVAYFSNRAARDWVTGA